MVAPKDAGRPTRTPYKTYLSLFPAEWAKLRAEAERRKISGREVIEAALSRYCASLPIPKPPANYGDPGPVDQGD